MLSHITYFPHIVQPYNAIKIKSSFIPISLTFLFKCKKQAVFPTQAVSRTHACELKKRSTVRSKIPARLCVHVRLFQRAAVAGRCHACSCKQRLVCCQSGLLLLLKAQILLVFHNVQPPVFVCLCVCVCAEAPAALTPSSLLCFVCS